MELLIMIIVIGLAVPFAGLIWMFFDMFFGKKMEKVVDF